MQQMPRTARRSGEAAAQVSPPESFPSFRPNGAINPNQRSNSALTVLIENLPTSMRENHCRQLLSLFGKVEKFRYLRNGAEKFQGWILIQMGDIGQVKLLFRLLDGVKVLQDQGEVGVEEDKALRTGK